MKNTFIMFIYLCILLISGCSSEHTLSTLTSPQIVVAPVYSSDAVYIQEDLIDTFNQMFIENNNEKELSICLTGYNTTINGWYPATIYDVGVDYVRSSCGENDSWLHSHPTDLDKNTSDSCHLSETDIKNTYNIIGVQCGKDQFAFYYKNKIMKIIEINPLDKSQKDISLSLDKTTIEMCEYCHNYCYSPCNSGMNFYCPSSNTEEPWCYNPNN